MTWHADTAVLDRYATGALDDASALSVEAHLVSCAACRAALAPAVAPERLSTIWHGVEEVLDAPRPAPVERVLRRIGVAEHVARLLAATPSLRLSWLAAVAFALGFAVLAAQGQWGGRGLLVFLTVAPILPVAGTAVAFGPSLDPTYELSLATPMHNVRLLILRAVAVVSTTTMLAGLAAIFLPQLTWMVAAWLVPALALTASTLALATWVSPERAAGAVSILWVTGVLVSEIAGAGGMAAFRAGGPVQSVFFHAPGQAVFLGLAAAAVLLVLRRRDSFEMAR